MARPSLPIRPDQVLELARRGWTVAEMAAFFACDRGTLYKRFAAELRRGRSEGPASRGPTARGRSRRGAASPCSGPTCSLHADWDVASGGGGIAGG